MSDYESHSGRIILQKRLDNETDKNYLKRVLGDKFKEEWWDEDESIQEFLGNCDLYATYFYSTGKLYFNVEHKELDPYEDIQELEGDDENGYTYFMRFYNGGTCLSEMIEESLDKVNTN